MPRGAPLPPQVVVLDVNETLSDLSPLAERFADVGAADAWPAWFPSVLRDGFALTAAGAGAPFADVARAALGSVLGGRRLDRTTEEAVAHVWAGFADTGVHPDVPGGVRRLRAAGFRLVTLSNGAAEVAERLLDRAGLRGEFERVLSVEDAPAWKPDRRAYGYAAEAVGVDPARMLLVAVHPWDIDGAARAAMRTAWIDRGGAPYPPVFTPPTLRATSLVELATALTADRAER